MAKQLNVSLAFIADTREAKAQLQDLQKQLNNILKMPSNKLGITDDIREAISATAELSSRLQQATNVNTGNLDFSKFNNSLKQSGQSLSSYGQQLQKLGPTGQQAFLTLTKSIATAEIPIKRTNALVKEFTTTLANTARWQVSSSVLHGLMGSMQSAYRYAQDLNKSLTDIRIVTGQSADQMARFAQQANSAAKQLSATTLEYTNASLIYYQQGLTDQQVKERTDVTIKMANVTRQSSETVSEQMTAVWNNFYNGSKSLEYYADVMTALGAATASSADEIAGGLEKFAAIGDTIGLSYEYAASALATITSNTRQSEEVVGTALKTIFARIQGLNLGETLEDGVTLNKYSAALQKIGISIFDSSGELKKMDNILDEMGSKWETLSKAQQTALAQTVAGTRQYTQLVALMDNWDKGDSDSMKANLNTAYGSTGALQDQADIYAESWEAAQDRVTAAAEKIYSALLNDDFFIDILNGFEKVLTFVNQLIDNLGGLRGVLLALGAIVTKVFSAQISQGLTNMAYNIKMMTKSGRESVEKERRAFIDNAVNNIPQSNEYTTDVEKAQQDSLRTELTLQMEYMDNAEKMSAIEADTNKKLIERTRILKEHTVELNKRKSSIDDNISNKTMSLRGAIQLENEANPEGNQINYEKQVKPLTDQIKTISSIQAILQDTTNVISAVGQAGEQGSKTMQLFKADLMSINTDNMSAEIKTFINEINQMGDSPDPVLLKEKIEALNFELEKLSQKNVKKIKTFVPKETRDDVDNLTQSFREQAIVQRELNQTNRDSAESYRATIDGVHGAKGAQKQWSDVMVESANVAFNVASAISMVSSAIDTLKDPDVSGMQKLVTVLSTMGMVLPTIISLIGTMKKLFSSETVAKIANAAATWAQVAAEKSLNKTKGEGSEVTKKNIKETWQDTVWKSTKKENQDKYIEQVLKDKGYVRDKKTGGWGKTTVGKNGAKRFDASTVISNDDAVKMATPDAQKMAGKGAFKALGSKVASAGIAAAGIAIIIGTVAMVVNQLNKAEKAVEKAKAAAQSLSENYDNVKASYDNFINAQSGYETATASMEELTKGTVEYQEALMQANEAAGELLATNKNLKYTIEDGKIVIDEDSLEQAKVDELKKIESAQAAKMAGQQELNEAEIALNKRDMARDLKSDADKNQKGWNAGIGGVLGAAGAGLAAGGIAGLVTGSVTGPGAIITGIVGAVAGLVTGVVTGIVQETSTDAENEAIDLLAEQAEKDETFLARLKSGEVEADELTELGIKDEALIASLQENGEKVAELVGEMAANTAAINAQNDLVAANALADNEAVQDSEYKDQIIDIAGDAYGHAYDKAMESEWVDSWGKDGISKANGANKEAKKVFDEYLKYAGLEGQGYKLTDTTGTDKNRQFVYKDKEGNEHKVSLEAMQAARAAYEASETLDNSATKLAETFDKLANSSDEADQALLSFVSGKNFEGASKGELEDIQSEVGDIGYNAETGEYDSSKVKTYLESSLGETLTDDVAIRYGYESADAMMDAFAKQLYNADIAWDNIKVPDNFKFADDMSLGTAKALESQIEKIELGPLGEEAGKEYVDKLNSMLSEVDTEDQQEALEALTAIDWSDWDALEQADAIMKQYGVDIDTTSEEWIAFADKMRKAAGATPDFSELKNTLTSITAILQKLDFGSVVSDEDYQKLVAYNDEWERFFMLQADGTRVFIGDAQAMQRETRADIVAQREALQSRKEAQEGFEKANWGHKGEDGSWVKADWGNISGSDTGTATNLMNASGATEDMLEELGYTDEVIQDMITKATSGQADLVAEGEAALREMYQRIDSFTEEELAEMDAQFDEMMASTATNVQDLQNLLNTDQISEEAYDKQLSVLANNASSLEELQQIKNAGLNEDVGLDTYEYGQALLNLADQYSNCTEEAEAYSKALLTGDSATIEAAQSALEAAVEVGELAEKYDLNAEELEDYGKRLKELHKGSNLSLQDANKLAAANMRLDRGVSNLNDNLDDYKKALKSSNRGSAEWSKTLSDLKTDLADILNVADGSMLSDTFAEATLNSEDLKKALDGDGEALLRLRLSAADDIIANLDVDDTTLAEVNSDWEYLKANLANDIAAGGINDEKMVAAFNDMIAKGNMTKDQIEAALAGLNVSANVHTEYVAQKVSVPTTITDQKRYITGYDQIDTNADGTLEKVARWRTETQTHTGPPVEVDGYVPKYTIEGTEGDGSVTSSFTQLPTPTVSKSSTTSGKNSNSGGGGDSTPSVASKTDTTKKSDVVDRYKEVTDQISKLGREMDKLSNAQDELWGTDRLNNIQEQIDLIDEETAALERQRDEAAAYMAEDATNVQQAASKLGISFNIEDGYITDYEDQMAKVYQDLADAEATYNSYYNEKYANMSEDELSKLPESERKAIQQAADDQAAYEKTTLEPLRESLAELEEAMGLYEESAEKFRESEDALEEKERQKRALQYQKWTEQLELEIGFDEDDIELFEHLISVLGDNFYQMAEALAYMVGSLEDLQNGEFGGQMQGYLNQLETYNDQYAELNRLKEEGKISDSAYIEGLATIKEGMMTNVAAIAEMDEAMMNYYGDTLDAAMDELSTYTDLVEHSSTVLDHYSSILEILGKSSDLQKMNAILEGQASVAKNQADISAAWYKDRAKDAADLQRQYQNAVDAGADAATIEGLKKKWMDAQAVANEAQDKMLSDAAAWAEALRAVVENELAMMAESLEQDLTGKFGSFDEMNTAMERASSLQEEYLTTTNQVYETNKMIRAAQQEIDKSTNSVAKRRLKQFTEETAELQNQTKLSKYELDIQQAKYDLLLAEIALEEAQQAKSTVRLQRDSEGNFGYVYTADQNQVSDAQQKLEDAQNALYNKGLEGANDYSQKYAETMQEMYDTLTGIQEAYLNGEIKTQAEYNEAMTAAQEYYYQKLEDFSSLYQVAVTTDSRVIKDAWSSDFGQMTYNTAEWKVNVSDYVAGVSDAFFEWQTEMAGIESLVGSSLSEIESNVGNLTANSQDLADTTINEVIPALDDEIDKVDGLTSEYMELRQSILDVIGEYNTLIETMNSVPRTTYNNGTTNNGNNNTNNTNGNNNTNNTNGNNNTNNSNTNNTNNNGNGNTNRGGNTSNGTGNPLTANKTQAEIDATWEEILEAYQHINSGEWGTGMEGRISKGSSAGYDEDVIRAAQQLINYTYDKAHGGQGYSIDIARDKMGFGAEAGREYEEKIAKLAKEHALEEEELIKRKELELEQLREEQALIEKRMKLEEEKMRMEEEYRRQDYEQLLEMHSQAIGGRRYGGSGGHGGSGSYDKFEVFQERELELRKEFMLQQQMMLEQEMKAAEIMKNLDLEKILQTLELQALNAQVGGLLTSPALGRPQGDILEQRVYIEAHFPDVENRNEIEEAFTMLINQASQYANRK